MLDFNPLLELCNFNIEVNKQLQIKATYKLLRVSEQLSQINKILINFNEANIIYGKKTWRIVRYNNTQVYFTSVFTLRRAL